MSAYPGDQQPAKQTTKIKQFLTAGIDTFVCLQQKDELARFAPYQAEVLQINATLAQPKSIEFLSLQIPGSYPKLLVNYILKANCL